MLSVNFADLFIPVFITAVFTYGLFKRINVFDSFVKGARENIKVGFELLPTLVLLMLAIGMFKASGALDGFVSVISPLATKIGIPAECVPLAILKPVSGSGALTVLESIFKETSPDSLAGMVASVMAGSTETTFYTLAVYFSATKVRSTRYALASALLGDFTAIILSCIAVRIMM